MLYFQGPTRSFDNFYERAKFLFVWKTFYIFYLVITSLTTYIYFVNFQFFFYFLSVFLIFSVGLLFLWFHPSKKTYSAVSKLLFSTATIVIGVSLFSVTTDLHYHEALWMIVISLSSFFCLNRWWGTAFLVLNSLLYSIFFLVYFSKSEFQSLVSNTALHIDLAVEFFFAMLPIF